MPKRHSCMVVEDSPTQALALRVLLEQNDYDVQVAENGIRALEMLKDFAPDIIVSDIVMPEMDGLELCKAVKSNPKLGDVGFMLFTNLSGPDDIFRALECGADNFVAKSADDSQILGRIEYLIANRTIREEKSLEAGIEVHFGGQRQFITSSRLQILNLLLSSYDVAVQKSRELETTSQKLVELNDSLEQKIEQRTKHLEEEIARRRRAEAQMHKQARLSSVLESAASAANQSKSIAEATELVVHSICKLIRWPVGHYFQLSEKNELAALESREVWYGPTGNGLSKFVEESQECTFERGDGLTGKVFATGKSCWIEDIESHPEYLRQESAVAASLKTTVAVPVEMAGTIIGVMEFFHYDALPEDKELINALEQCSYHLSRMYERELAASALAARESLFNAILNNTSAVIYVKDLAGRYITVNKRFEERFGLSEDAIIGNDDTGIFGEEASIAIMENDRRIIESGVAEVFEESISVDGERRYYISLKYPLVDGKGKVYAIAGNSTDITERRRNEELRRLLEAAIHQSPTSVVIVSANGEIMLVNDATADVVSRPCDKIRRISDLDIGRSELTKRSVEEVWTDFVQTDADRAEDTFVITSNGKPRAWNLRISKVEDTDGGTTHTLLVIRDISEARSLERKIQRKHRLESIGTLAGGIAHDFNNILSVILGYAEFALEKLDDPDRLRDDLQRVHAAGQRARLLVQQILRFSRAEPGTFTNLDLEYVVKEMLNLADAIVPKFIKLSYEIDPECKSVRADANQLDQLLLNLITNSVQAIGDETGEIEITLEPCTICPDEYYIHPDLTIREYVRIKVRDDGPGMDQDTLEQIFDPFFTTKSASEGTGLGLANCHTIAREHGGAITAYSEPGAGTEFHIYIPAADSEVKNETDDVTPARETRGSERILAVDDVESLALMVERRLSSSGYEVVIETDPLAALERIKSNPHEFDLIITDSAMPGLTGEQLAEAAYEMRPDLPVIIQSGYSAKGADSPLSPNVKCYLGKPVSGNALLTAVRDTIDDASNNRE